MALNRMRNKETFKLKVIFAFILGMFIGSLLVTEQQRQQQQRHEWIRVGHTGQTRANPDTQEINSINQFIQNAGEHKDKQQQQKQQQQDQPEGASSSLSVAKEVKLEADEEHRDRQEYLNSLPHTYYDIEIAGVPKGRIVFALYNDTSPLAAENFRQLCTGEKDTAPAGSEAGPLWLKDKYFYRIIDQFIDQTGAGDNSVYGGYFKDDKKGLELKHERPGLLSMANIGPDTNSGHFSILMNSAPHLDGHYVIFGEVVHGYEIAQEINSYSKGKPDNTAGVEVKAKIAFAGQCKTLECTD